MELSDKEKINALNEVRILASTRNPHIICYKEVFLTENSNYLWSFIYLSIIMEYTNDGDLY
jgi:NIMA (never in mitosis gene a)-related kinase